MIDASDAALAKALLAQSVLPPEREAAVDAFASDVIGTIRSGIVHGAVEALPQKHARGRQLSLAERAFGYWPHGRRARLSARFSAERALTVDTAATRGRGGR